MTKSIDIKESIYDKNSEFNIKRFKIGKITIERPTRTINAKILTKNLLRYVIENFSNAIFEYSKLVSLKAVNYILSETSDVKIQKFFGFKNWMEGNPYIFSQTLTFNPYKEFGDIEKMSGYLDYCYNFSDPILLIPNIKIEKYDRNTGNKVPIINIKEYIQFVKAAFQILNYKNKKPIFVPMSLKFGIDDTKKLAREYIKNEFFNVWIDFESSAITKSKVSRIRAFLREFDFAERLDNLIIFSTNIKREIISNLKSDRTPASDVLATLVGCNLVGVNREPPRPIENTLDKEHLAELKKHKARVFDPNTYYYLKLEISDYNHKIRNLLMDPKFNILFNSSLIDKEFFSQTNYFLEKESIKDYIAKKAMMKEYKEGELIKLLFHGEARKIIEWF